MVSLMPTDNWAGVGVGISHSLKHAAQTRSVRHPHTHPSVRLGFGGESIPNSFANSLGSSVLSMVSLMPTDNWAGVGVGIFHSLKQLRKLAR